MKITDAKNGSELTVQIEGRVDTMTSPELDKYLASALDGVTKLVLDFAEVSYISSAGLRVLLTTQKTMNKQGSMELHNVNDVLMEIFEVTGFQDILTII